MGHTVLGKTVTDNFKTKKRRKAKPEELMIFKNTHDAIIDEETWNNAQRLKRTVRREVKNGTYKNRLTGLVYQFGEPGKAETCASLSAILPQAKDSDTKQIINSTLKKLNALSEETCAELTATTKRRKTAERDHSIRTRLAKAKEQSKQPTVDGGKRHRTHSRGKGNMEI